MAADGRAPGVGRRAFLVYYKVPASSVPALLQAFGRLTATAQSWSVELMRRAGPLESDPALQTWMEVYRVDERDERDERDDEQLEKIIEARARDCGICALVAGERHYEVFEPCA